MSIEGKGKYLGKRKIEIDQDLNLSPDSEIFYLIEEIKPVKQSKETKKNPWEEIAKNAVHLGRFDLSEKYHEILYDLDSKDG